jgi:hypothetical protein
VEPIKILKLDESMDPIKFSCHSAVASLKGKEAKIIELNADPMTSQPKIARVKEDFDLRRLIRASDSAVNFNSSVKSIFRAECGDEKPGNSHAEF